MVELCTSQMVWSEKVMAIELPSVNDCGKLDPEMVRRVFPLGLRPVFGETELTVTASVWAAAFTGTRPNTSLTWGIHCPLTAEGLTVQVISVRLFEISTQFAFE